MQLVSKLARCSIADDTWQSGDNYLLPSIRVSLGEDARSSTCEFSVLDPGFLIGAKYRQISIEAGGILVPAELLQSPTATKPVGGSTPTTDGGNTGLSGFQGGDQDATVRAIIAECQKQGVTDPAQIAYVLGTVQHESGFKPIPEIDGASAWYAPYYGRGFVQITHEANYRKYQDLLGIPLVSQPDLALRPDVAAFILVHGMRTGNFTGRKLSDYISGDNRDFYNARRIVNGTDRASLIAGYAEQWLQKLPQYLGSGVMAAQPATPSVSSPQTVPATVETSAKGTEIIIELGVGWGLTFKDCISFHFLHTGTESSWAQSGEQITTFSGKSVRWLLTRVPVTQSFENVTFKQYLEDRCRQFGLKLEMEGSGLTYTHLSQDGQTHLDLILREARRIGFSIKEGSGSEAGKLIVEPTARPKFTGFVIDEEVLVKPARFTDEARSSSAMKPLETVSSPGTTTGQAKTAIERASGDMTQVQPENMAGTGNAPTGTGMTTGATAPAVGGTVSPVNNGSASATPTANTPLTSTESESIADKSEKTPLRTTTKPDGTEVSTEGESSQRVESGKITRTEITRTQTIEPRQGPVFQTLRVETVITDEGRKVTTTLSRPGLEDEVTETTAELTAEDKRLLELSKRKNAGSGSTSATPGAGLPNQPDGAIDLLDGKAEAQLIADESKRVKGYEDSFVLTMNMDTLQLVPSQIIGISGRLFPSAFATEKRIYSVDHDFDQGTTTVSLYVPQAPPPEAASSGSGVTQFASPSTTATNPGGFIFPIPSGATTIGDGYGTRPGRPPGYRHTILDITAPNGTPVVAMADGTVVDIIPNNGGAGNSMYIQYAGGYESGYFHGNGDFAMVGKGPVKQGQPVFRVGSTGHSSGEHLHVLFTLNGSYCLLSKVGIDVLKLGLPVQRYSPDCDEY